MDRAGWQQIAEDRILDAKALLDADRWACAYYVAGYAVECALKSCVLKYVAESGVIFDDEKWAKQVRTHDLGTLVKLANLEAPFGVDLGADQNLRAYWGDCQCLDGRETISAEGGGRSQGPLRGPHQQPARGDAMDTETLVEQRIDDGRRLIKELERGGFDVKVALWAKTGEEGKWRLYLASKAVEATGLASAYQAVYEALDRIQVALLSSSDIRVIAADAPVAQDAVDARRQSASPGPTVYSGWLLGDTPMHGAYIYPPSPLRLTPEDAVARMISLVQRQGATRPSLVSLRDGSSFQGVPSGLEISSGGPRNRRFFDVATNQTRTLQAEEVVGID